MGFIEKIKRDPTINPEDRVEGHLFEDAITLWLTKPSEVTKQNIVNYFKFNAADANRLDEIKASFDAEPSNVAKLTWLFTFNSAVRAFQYDIIDLRKLKAIIGLV